MTNNVIIRPSVEADVDFLKDRLRKSDLNEIVASNNIGPEMALRIGFERSILCLTIDNGCPVAMFGINVNDILGDVATVWLLATNELNKIMFKFVKESRKFINLMLGYYPILENYVDVRNKKSIKWLRFCGAEIDCAVPYGISGLMFRKFRFRRYPNV